jgi:hypothetical protein
LMHIAVGKTKMGSPPQNLSFAGHQFRISR